MQMTMMVELISCTYLGEFCPYENGAETQHQCVVAANLVSCIIRATIDLETMRKEIGAARLCTT